MLKRGWGGSPGLIHLLLLGTMPGNAEGRKGKVRRIKNKGKVLLRGKAEERPKRVVQSKTL